MITDILQLSAGPWAAHTKIAVIMGRPSPMAVIMICGS
jgi:hypothetical protein